jgi:hypothetical protein
MTFCKLNMTISHVGVPLTMPLIGTLLLRREVANNMTLNMNAAARFAVQWHPLGLASHPSLPLLTLRSSAVQKAHTPLVVQEQFAPDALQTEAPQRAPPGLVNVVSLTRINTADGAYIVMAKPRTFGILLNDNA